MSLHNFTLRYYLIDRNLATPWSCLVNCKFTDKGFTSSIKFQSYLLNNRVVTDVNKEHHGFPFFYLILCNCVDV